MTELKPLSEINPEIGTYVYCHNESHQGTRFKVTRDWKVWQGRLDRWWTTDPDFEQRTWSEIKVNDGTPPDEECEVLYLMDRVDAVTMSRLVAGKYDRGCTPSLDKSANLRFEIINNTADITFYRTRPLPKNVVHKYYFDGKELSHSRLREDKWEITVEMSSDMDEIKNISWNKLQW